MHRTTRRDVTELLSLVGKMDEAFNTWNRADDESKRRLSLVFCEAMGMVIGQSAVVKIDFDVYERQDHVGDLISDLVATVERVQKCPAEIQGMGEDVYECGKPLSEGGEFCKEHE